MMRKSLWVMMLALLLLSGCATVEAPEKTEATILPPQTAPTMETTQTVVPTEIIDVVLTPTPDVKDDDEEFYFVEYYKDNAESCRTVVDGIEYYLDTNYYLFQDYFPEFPLYKINENGFPEYMGTTGYWFQVNGDYLYIKSDVLQEDWPDGTLTRVVSLNDGTVKPVKRNIDIFIPSQSDCVYFTWWNNQIFIADQSLEVKRVIEVQIPDLKKIEEKSGENLEWYEQTVHITDIKNGWIYFRFYIFEYEGPGLYEGNYRITADGKKIDKIDEGQLLEY